MTQPTPRPAPTVVPGYGQPKRRQRDFDKINRNLKKLIEQKATDQDLDAYLQHEGVTLDEALQNAPPAPQQQDGGIAGMVTDAAETVGRVGQKAYDYIFPEQDPAHTDTPSMTDPRAVTQLSKMTALSDEAYHDVLKSNLGDQYLGTEKDANGFPIIVYKDFKTGEPTRAYVNKPGPDWQDLDRIIAGALPYVAGGMVAGGAARALGGTALARGGAQAAAAGGVSIGQDVAARQQGSEQPVDFTRAALTAGMGGLAEVVPLPVAGAGVGGIVGAASGDNTEEMIAGGLLGAGGGALAGKGVNALLRGPKPPNSASPQVRARAKAAGLNPDEMTDDQLQQFAAAMDRVTDEKEFAASLQTDRFGIPTTKGQRTKDPQLLTVEKDARYGNLGDDAKRLLDEFDKRQAAELEVTALGRTDLDMQALQGTRMRPPERGGVGIGRMINDDKPVSRFDIGSGGQGARIQQGISAAKSEGDKAINQAWDEVGLIYPHQQAFSRLPGIIDDRVGDMMFDPQTMPAAGRMVETLKRFMGGEEAPMGVGLGQPQTRRMDMDFVRRRLLQEYQDAAPGPDQRAARAIYDGFNDWIDDVAEAGLVAGGDPTSAVKLRTAREITKEIKGLWSASGRGSKAADRILQRLSADDVGADRIISELFGGSGTHTPPKAGVVEALGKIKQGLERFGGDRGSSVWNDIRLAYWSRLVLNKKGEMHTPQMMLNNLQQALRNQNSVMRTLYSPAEMSVLRDYARALKHVAYKDPNPSGTATAVRAAMRQPGLVTGSLKLATKSQAERERFTRGRIALANIYRIIARNIPNAVGAKDQIGTMAARRAIDPNMTMKAPPVRGPVGAASGQQLLEAFDAMQPNGGNRRVAQ